VLAADVPATTPAEYPGVTATVDGYSGPTVYYSEAMEIGYRWYDQQNIAPLYPFGFGLSYTTFSISNVTVTPSSIDGTQPIMVNATVQNTGSRYGAEVVQVYLGLRFARRTAQATRRFPEGLAQPRASKQVLTITIDPAATITRCRIGTPRRTVGRLQSGAYTLYVGNSSRDISFTGSINVTTGPNETVIPKASTVLAVARSTLAPASRTFRTSAKSHGCELK